MNRCIFIIIYKIMCVLFYTWVLAGNSVFSSIKKKEKNLDRPVFFFETEVIII